MSGYSIWYLLRPNHPLHAKIAQINKELGSKALPAHIPVLNNLKLLETAIGLFEAYDKKQMPTFRIPERPQVFRSGKFKNLGLPLRTENSVWELPIAKRTDMFYNDEIRNITFKEGFILPEEYELVIMDCRTRDSDHWKLFNGR